MAWGSGAKQAGKSLQVAINHCGLLCSIDGIIGNKTINCANAIEPRVLFDALTNERERFFYAIGVGKNAKFLTGWINRLNDYRKTFRP
jgi:lysozyme family protein